MKSFVCWRSALYRYVWLFIIIIYPVELVVVETTAVQDAVATLPGAWN